MSKVNLEKHVWEGWRVVDFINNLEPIFNMIMNNQSYIKPFTTKEEVKDFCMNHQPYYKKNIPDVVNYFYAKIK